MESSKIIIGLLSSIVILLLIFIALPKKGAKKTRDREPDNHNPNPVPPPPQGSPSAAYTRPGWFWKSVFVLVTGFVLAVIWPDGVLWFAGITLGLIFVFILRAIFVQKPLLASRTPTIPYTGRRFMKDVVISLTIIILLFVSAWFILFFPELLEKAANYDTSKFTNVSQEQTICVYRDRWSNKYTVPDGYYPEVRMNLLNSHVLVRVNENDFTTADLGVAKRATWFEFKPNPVVVKTMEFRLTDDSTATPSGFAEVSFRFRRLPAK